MQPTQSGAAQAPSSSGPGLDIPREGLTMRDHIIRFGGLAIIDAIAIWFAYSLIGNGQTPAAVILLIVTAVVNYLFLDDRVYPIRWLTPGLVMMLLTVIYPLVFTLYIGLTNYSDGHLLTKDQVVTQLQGQYFAPENATVYKWTAYRNDAGQFKLLLQAPDGKYYVGADGQEVQPINDTTPPATLEGGYNQLNRIQGVQYLSTLQSIQVLSGDSLIRITGLDSAPTQQRVYSYDAGSGNLTNNRTGTVYTDVQGTFTSTTDPKDQLSPGFTAVVGFQNYLRVFTDSNIQGPFFGVLIWTIIFALFSVGLTFAVGLGIAIVMNDKDLPLKPVFRSIAILPYTIPAFISALIWVGLMNPLYGPFNAMIANLTGGFSPPWFSDGTWAKVGILFVNTWLGFPYMMLLCLGALQSIPTDMYEAADLDGASPFQQFWKLTLPMLLISVGPLLIGSFAYNFNNFSLIELFNAGGPPIVGANTPAGQTDILISYTYRLAFAGGRGADFGLASAIAVFIFLIVASITVFNFRYTKQLEEVR